MLAQARELVADFADSATAFEARRPGSATATGPRRCAACEAQRIPPGTRSGGGCPNWKSTTSTWTPATGPRTGRLISPVSACRGNRQLLRPRLPVALLRATDDGSEHRIGPPGEEPAITLPGQSYALLAWLLGRSDGSGLSATPTGPLPPVPRGSYQS